MQAYIIIFDFIDPYHTYMVGTKTTGDNLYTYIMFYVSLHLFQKMFVTTSWRKITGSK